MGTSKLGFRPQELVTVYSVAHLHLGNTRRGLHATGVVAGRTAVDFTPQLKHLGHVEFLTHHLSLKLAVSDGLGLRVSIRKQGARNRDPEWTISTKPRFLNNPACSWPDAWFRVPETLGSNTHGVSLGASTWRPDNSS